MRIEIGNFVEFINIININKKRSLAGNVFIYKISFKIVSLIN